MRTTAISLHLSACINQQLNNALDSINKLTVIVKAITSVLTWSPSKLSTLFQFAYLPLLANAHQHNWLWWIIFYKLFLLLLAYYTGSRLRGLTEGVHINVSLKSHNIFHLFLDFPGRSRAATILRQFCGYTGAIKFPTRGYLCVLFWFLFNRYNHTTKVTCGQN